MDVTGGLAKAISEAPAEFQPILQGLANTLVAAFQQALGESLAALTAERTEAIDQAADRLHELLDRLNGAAVTLGHGVSPYGFTLVIPERKTT
jgi:hypothetical protein